MEELLQAQGLETEIYWVGNQPIRDCTGCRACRKTRDNTCVFKDDDINLLIKKAEAADGFVFGTPVYYSHPTGALLSVLDRVFYAGGDVLRGKPGCSFAIARRGSTTLALQVINQYFLYNEMPLASGSYWAMLHGVGAGGDSAGHGRPADDPQHDPQPSSPDALPQGSGGSRHQKAPERVRRPHQLYQVKSYKKQPVGSFPAGCFCL